MIFSRWAGVIETPPAKPYCTAKSAVSSTAISKPPSLTNFCRLAMPDQPIPGLMSSVSSTVPRFGVISVFFHGMGLPNIGMPVMMAWPAARPIGGKRITSNLERRAGSLVTSCVLM